MKKFFFIALLLGFYGCSFSQTSIFVMDGDGYPFPDASVFHKNKLVGKTNKEGLINVSKIPAGETVVIKFGKLSTVQVIQKKEKDQKRTIAVYLVPTEMKEVHVMVEEGDRSGPVDFDIPPPPPYSENDIYDVVDESAEFPGGWEALSPWILKNFVYPETAIEASLQGKCYVRFVVEKDGSITNVKVVRSVANCPQCDAEAVRVVKAMPNWIPGKIKGKPVRSHFNLPVTFKLDK